jgi:hypothetical protein
LSAAAAQPRRASLRRYVTTVAAGHCTLCGLSRATDGEGLPIECLIFAGLTFICGRITLEVPSRDDSFTVSEVFAFSSVLLFGPEAGAVTLALDSLVPAWHRRTPLDKAIFNFGNLTLAVWLSAYLEASRCSGMVSVDEARAA